MSGDKLPYHLRVKKEIDRHLFMEQIKRVMQYYGSASQYSYIGMAGPFSHDFKKMYEYFDFKRFISYEKGDDTFKRQKFNAPFSTIEYIKDDIKNFIQSYPKFGNEELEKIVIWLDYTDFNADILTSLEDIIKKADIGSIIKVTVRAHASSLGLSNNSLEDTSAVRVKKLQDILGDNYFLVDTYKRERLTAKGYPVAIFEHLMKISHDALKHTKEKIFKPMASYLYEDGMTMLTFSGVVINREHEYDFFEKSELKNWEFGLYKNESDPSFLEINVPFLSQKEILRLGYYLPLTPKRKAKLVGISNEDICNLIKFYKFYPSYSKIL